MLSLARGSRRTTSPPRRRVTPALAAALAVNAVVIAAFVGALSRGYVFGDSRPDGSAAVQPERIGFVQLPRPGAPTPPIAQRDGGDGRPLARAPRPERPATRPSAPGTVPTGVAPAAPTTSGSPAGTAAEGGSGAVVGSGGPIEGIQPSYSDPRLWTRPGAVVTAPRTAKERIDSVIADRLGPVRDSILAARELAAGQRAPGDWTMKGPGGKWGMDQSSIHLGKVKVPNAVLALLSESFQRNLRGNPTEINRERSLATIRQEILSRAEREMNEDDFQRAVKAVRARKDRERAARRAARDPGIVAEQGSEGRTPAASGASPER